MSTAAQQRDQVTAWLDKHVGEDVTATILIDEDSEDAYHALEALRAEGALTHDGFRDEYRIGETAGISIPSRSGAVHTSSSTVRRHAVHFLTVDLADGITLSIVARPRTTTNKKEKNSV